jgi:DDE superfamily endonuclease
LRRKINQGLQHFHSHSQTPKRKPPKQPLSKQAKRANRKLASLRITVEHVIRDRSAELTTKPEDISYPQKLTATNVSVLGLGFTSSLLSATLLMTVNPCPAWCSLISQEVLYLNE